MPNPRRRRLRPRCLPCALAVLLVVTQIQAAQQAAAPAPPPATPQQTPAPPQPLSTAQLPVEQNLKVRVLAGNGEMNDLQRHVMAPLVVQVVDQNERAIDGAEVVFRFPLNGPSATFLNGRNSVTVRTNSGGQAAAVNWMANGQVGSFQVQVTATYGNEEGATTVSMTNVTRIEENATAKAEHKSLWSHRWFKIAVIGGAAAGVAIGVILATRGSGSGRTVTISPGAPTITN